LAMARPTKLVASVINIIQGDYTILGARGNTSALCASAYLVPQHDDIDMFG